MRLSSVSRPQRSTHTLAPLLAVCLVAGAGLSATGWARAQSANEGQAHFQRLCSACHTVGGGRGIGPDLAGVTQRRERAWLERWIAAPDKMLAEKDPIAVQLFQEYNNVPMLNLGLTRAQVASVIAYLESPGAVVAPAAHAALPAGDPMVGKNLFTGVARLKNGAPACMACHSVAGIGALGGGALGPDLTPAPTKYGDAGLASVLATMPFPTMMPIFGKRPLTPEEQAHLKAFLAQPVAQRPARAVGQLALLALLGGGALLGLVQVTWRDRLQGVRRPMVGGKR